MATVNIPFNKHYDLMTRIEKRAYKRWLAKNELWDGAVVIENQVKTGRLVIGRGNYEN